MANQLATTRPHARLRIPRRRSWGLALFAVVLSAAFVAAIPAQAAQPGVVQVSADPYTAANAPSGEHATEVEPDTFAWGSTMVYPYPGRPGLQRRRQRHRFATSTNGACSWTRVPAWDEREAIQPRSVLLRQCTRSHTTPGTRCGSIS